MQDEVVKHTKKIYKTVKSHTQTFTEKVKEVIVEIFIIVFAVTLSIWLHGWSEHRQEQVEVREFLSDLKEDLTNDLTSMQSAKQSLSKDIDNFSFIESLTKSKIDSLFKINPSFGFHSSIGTTKINNGNYEGFKSSGKIGFIENKDLKKRILKYYQDITPSISEAEKINASQILKISDFWADNISQDVKQMLLSPKFKTMLQIFQSTAKSSLDLYQDAITSGTQIITQIDSHKNE